MSVFLRSCSKLMFCIMAMALLHACASLPNAEPPRVSVVGIEPLQGEGMELRFNVKLRIQNPNTMDINYQGMMVDLLVDGRRIASGVSNQAGKVPGYGESVYSLPITVSALDAIRKFIDIAQKPAQNAIPYELKGKLESGLFGTVRFSDKGNLQLPK